MRDLLSLLLLVWGLFACEARPSPTAARVVTSAVPTVAGPVTATVPTLPSGNFARGKALVAKFECHRCHEGTGLAELPRERHCVRCHQDIEAGKVSADPTRLARWKRGLVGVSHAPTLAGTARFEPGWVERYLLSPSDLRPSLISTMPRLELTPDDARDIAAYLAAAEALPLHAKVRAGDAAVGRRVAESRGCATCHAFSGMSGWPNARGAGPAVELAPDLQKARERFSHDVLGSWLENPAAMKPDTLMPNLALTEAERADLVAFILEEPLEPASPSEFVRLPILERRVSYAEVDARVFSVTCRHCHSSNEVAFGDGGPGYDGGFGFAARRIDLSSHRGVSSGMLDRKGERQSLFAPTTSGKPRLLAALLVRHREERGEIDPDLRGMPLGLPALTAEQVQLVESWIAQGRPL